MNSGIDHIFVFRKAEKAQAAAERLNALRSMALGHEASPLPPTSAFTVKPTLYEPACTAEPILPKTVPPVPRGQAAPDRRPMEAVLPVSLKGDADENRLLFLAGGTLTAMLLFQLIPWKGVLIGSFRTANDLLQTCGILAMGACLLLMRKKSISRKLMAGGGLLLINFLQAYRVIQRAMGMINAPGRLFRHPVFYSQWRSALVSAALIAGLVLLVDALCRARPLADGQLAPLAGGAYFLIGILLEHRYFAFAFQQDFADRGMIVRLGNLAISALVLGLSISFSGWLCRMNATRPLHLSTGAKVWFWLVTAANAVTLVMLLMARPLNLITVLFALGLIAASVLLLMGRRIGLPVYILSGSAAISCNVLFLVELVVSPRQDRKAVAGAVLSGGLNMLIMWLAVALLQILIR